MQVSYAKFHTFTRSSTAVGLTGSPAPCFDAMATFYIQLVNAVHICSSCLHISMVGFALFYTECYHLPLFNHLAVKRFVDYCGT